MRSYFTAPRTPLTLRRQQECLWLGFSAGFQQAFDTRWPNLHKLAERGWLVFVSIAPMRERMTLPPDLLALGDRAWVIVAGEQGRHEDCRDMDPDWARAIRDQCATAGVAFFMKQLARKAPIPIDLMIRQFPAPRLCVGGGERVGNQPTANKEAMNV
jgi:protein gp37